MSDLYAIAIHGGAGAVFPRSEQQAAAYLSGLSGALERGLSILRGGGASLDAVVEAVALLEDDPLFNAGRGAVFTHDGGHRLDASVMCGRERVCGAVTGVQTVKNPVRLARLVLERTPYVLLAAEGAETFARAMGVEMVDPRYFDTEHRRQQWLEALAAEQDAGRAQSVAADAEPPSAPGMPSAGDQARGTVGAVALDCYGDLCAAGSTGGMKNVRFGRVGDTPQIGAGLWADNDTCAIACTGTGEQFVRHAVAHDIHARMAYAGSTLEGAAAAVIQRVLKPGDGGIVGVDRAGKMVMIYNSQMMFRGGADHTGRFEVSM